jgi:hypothetical protein
LAHLIWKKKGVLYSLFGKSKNFDSMPTHFRKILHFAMGMGLIFQKIGWWLLYFECERLALMVFIHVLNIDKSLKTSW